ncbi:MAG: two-component sensor histidine kinase, partial [Rhodospirillales bacterium]|nr:two-component sensor histidine kinase [Rhodospirillales bacterium]
MTASPPLESDTPPRKQGLIKRFLPKSLLGRTLLIIVTPLILLQVVSGYVFYENHWDKVSRRLATSVAGDVASISALFRRAPDAETREWIRSLAFHRMEMRVELQIGEILPNQPPLLSFDRADGFLVEALSAQLDKPFMVDTTSLEKDIFVLVQHGDGVLQVTTTRKRLSSSTTYVFVIWMVGTSMILFGVATLFMRNQIR